jgi:hypothetical protein
MRKYITIFSVLLPIVLFATTWATISVEDMMRGAELVAVCKVLSPPWEEDGHHRMPCLIKIKLIKVLIGNEKDTDLLVNWGDCSQGYKSLTQGQEYIVFLQRWDACFLDKSDKGNRRFRYGAFSINNNYQRFNSPYWIRPIIAEEVIWTNNQKISISNLVEMIRMEKNVANKVPGDRSRKLADPQH